MLFTLKTKIWLTVIAIVLMFSSFTFFFFPRQQSKMLMKQYNKEVQNIANFIAIGVQIAINQQNYEEVHTHMSTLSTDTRMKSVSIIMIDTTWDDAHTKYKIKESVFATYPATEKITNTAPEANDSLIFKKAPYHGETMQGSVLVAYRTSEIHKSEQKVWRVSIWATAIVMLTGIILGFWLSKRFSIPVLKLRDAAIRVGEGDLEMRIEKFTKDEIGDLSQAFNKMTDQLYQSRKKLNEANESLTNTNESLNKTLQELKSTQTQLIQSEKMASLGELTAGIAHEIQNPLNFVINFSEVSVEMVAELQKYVDSGQTEDAKEEATSLEQNLQKIIQHGKRADAIVKNMLQHSRTSTGTVDATDINALVDEYMRLSYHGLRAKNKSFNASLNVQLDPSIGKIKIVAQDIGRVILNIFNNAFYSVATKKAGNPNFSPMVTVVTKMNGSMVEITIIDNGIGIPKKELEKIFQPFFTTKPTGQGTGLGLSLSYDIIKAHNGQILVDTKEGEFASFTILLPG